MTTVRTFCSFLDERFPEATRQPDDFDGLQLCTEPDRPLTRVLCALDVSKSAVDACLQADAQLLLTHHPLFWGGIRSLNLAKDAGKDTRAALTLVRANIACFTLHTRFDAAKGGMNDTLANKLALCDCTPIASPVDPIPLARMANTPEPFAPRDFAHFVAKKLGKGILFTEGSRPVHRVMLVTGGGKADFDLFLQSGADCFVTGELSHALRVEAADRGLSLIEAGHYGTESLFCEAITPFLRESFPALEILSFPNTPHECIIQPE